MASDAAPCDYSSVKTFLTTKRNDPCTVSTTYYRPKNIPSLLYNVGVLGVKMRGNLHKLWLFKPPSMPDKVVREETIQLFVIWEVIVWWMSCMS
jgi:hypothetical protein